MGDNVNHGNNHLERLAAMKTSPLAKLSLPRLARAVRRPRLFQLLDGGRASRAIWVAGPGGAGKTTLAVAYIVDRELPYMWYQLDRDDADSATFFYYLGIAARHAAPGRDMHLPLLTPEYLSDIPSFTRRYFRELCSKLPQNMLLVLDNYQDLGEAPYFAEILHNGLKEMPPGINLLVLSRSEPPPELVGTNNTLTYLGWDRLRLTRDEARDLIIQSVPLEDAHVDMLHRRSEGWPAGVTLLLEQVKRKGFSDKRFDPATPETIFQFFANEFFKELPEDIRDFLLRTSLLAHMTPALAERVSGNGKAERILADLHRRHFFTYRRELAEASYQYHALFREFLLIQVEERYHQDQYLTLVRHTGHLLCEHNREEEAAVLYLKAQDWESAIALLLSQAPQLLAQGRANIVAGWLQQMPKRLVESMPWLLYWQGISHQFMDPFSARATLEFSYAGFVASDDGVGQMLAASAIIDSIFLLRGNMRSAISWVDALQKQLATYSQFPIMKIEARILTSLVSTLTVVRPQDQQLANYAGRLLLLLDEDIDINQKVFAAGHLLYYYSLIGSDLDVCDRIMRQTIALMSLPELTAINQLFGRHMCMLPLIMDGRVDTANEINRPVLGLVKQNNFHFMEGIAGLIEAGIYANCNNLDGLRALLERIEKSLNPDHPLDAVWYYFGRLLYCLATEDYENGLSYGQRAVELQDKLGLVSTVMATNCLIAICCCEMSRFEEARGYLGMARDLGFGGSLFIHHQILLIESYCSTLLANHQDGHERFREAVSAAERRSFFGCVYWWYPRRMMTRLCAEALRAGVEVEFVRETIRKRQLLPPEPLEAWPWPVKIFTLGQFTLEVGGQIVPEAISWSKPLTALAALITLGSAEVRIDHIAEVLWPDAEGDAATSAFTTTVSRLRKLIGDEAIIVKGGRVTLDEDRCWVDVRALERRIDQVGAFDAEGAGAEEHAAQLLDLYRGPFLNDEASVWAAAVRRRVRESFARCLARCVSKLQVAGRREAAAALLERVVAVDPEAMARLRLFEES